MHQKIITLLFVNGEPVSLKELASFCEISQEELATLIPKVHQTLVDSGLLLMEKEGTLQLVTSPGYSALVTSFLKKDIEGDLTPAMLQVLTIVAYIGSVSQADISFIRGVQSAQSLRTLMVRGLLTKQGEVYSLSNEALQYLGVVDTTLLPEYEVLHKDLIAKLAEAKQE